ncbi:hypothetical protein DZF91_12715 [Actinomadura logoneensis]|uniref:Uncharacterized protein n=1 Tax=Actinomadura logoneensis TaxID=2293572 RepID=A0A372JMN3_9ACTN|nr:hypothetical protein [Actinomadura logoneensis]RFU41281.1 hypothetical protein DZF91_12715 [Actinomadura logoneensis]
MTPDCTISVLHDVLRGYDRRFLELDRAEQDRLLDETRRFLGESGPSEETRAALPSAYRLRAFCIQRGLRDELERLIRDEAAGVAGGAVVVGGRVYAVYPYLRGVPRQDADITAEVGVDHRLDAASWKNGRLRLVGRAAVERVETRRTTVEVLLRDRDAGAEHRIAAEPTGDGGGEAFSAVADPAVLGPGRWDVHVAASALGVTREARFGGVRGPAFKLDETPRAIPLELARAVPAQEAQTATAQAAPSQAVPSQAAPAQDLEARLHLTGSGGHLTLLVGAATRPMPLRTRIRRRLAR